MDSLSEMTQKRNQSLIDKYGSMEAYRQKAKEWGSQGGKKGSNGLQKLTFEQRSELGKKNVIKMHKVMRERKEVEDARHG